MNVDEAKKAIKNNSIVFFDWDASLWGVLTCLSDDESGAYFKRFGMGLTCGFTKLEHISIVPLDKWGNRW